MKRIKDIKGIVLHDVIDYIRYADILQIEPIIEALNLRIERLRKGLIIEYEKD